MDSSTSSPIPSAPVASPPPAAAPSPPPHVPSTDIAKIAGIVRDVRAAYDRGTTRSVEWRDRQLSALNRMLHECEHDIIDALHEDVGKPHLEAWSAEVAHARGGLRSIRKGFRRWMKPERVTTPLIAQPGTSRVVREPLGVVLVIAPWNYPFELAFTPLAGAIAAGNCVIVKPSEVTPSVSRLLARIVPKYLDPECVRVVEGGVPETTELLTHRFDHIFYTGNGTVARIVMAAAAKHLTPVTLELGGKSPCIVDARSDLDVAARRIAWAKFYNCGQTCVAPDYVLAHERVYEELIDGLASTIRDFWGDDPQTSKDYGRIVNARHLARLTALLEGQNVVSGGKSDVADRYLEPTILRDVSTDSPVMSEEIFGPILPVLKIRDVDEAIHFVNARPKPLALYVFTGDSHVSQQVVERTSSGGVVVNHCILHLTVPGLPFGGVGPSGLGAYHGKHSFETFSHRKSVLSKTTMVDPSLMYPPYTANKEAWIRRLM